MTKKIGGNSLHPMTIAQIEALKVFSELGFEVTQGPELENEWYCFDALNVPKDHPARDMQDTFFVKSKEKSDDSKKSFVLRTHTTSATARAVEKAGKEGRLPCAFISVGKVFRNESTDATHEAMFYQVDGMLVVPKENAEEGSVSRLKGTLLHFYRKMLGEDVEIQLRPSFFPFVEPGLEVWVKFQDRWLEVMGAGIIHPNVLKNLGLDPEKYTGFAFGGGLDRIVMVKWNIPDVRLLYQGDLRINQF
ncbi:phenylalanine--tRNA ligase subunit alpha [Candidatus Nomurabacteria bacterium]|nr:phenylalanine--tRNA ligase subunit alpha [Candidatus Nomurabacteria bacterium]MCB9820876.1 phenylalanine--tRNA ligase subunit alpha [Candidatus Nomurabacteria bacterium]